RARKQRAALVTRRTRATNERPRKVRAIRQRIARTVRAFVDVRAPVLAVADVARRARAARAAARGVRTRRARITTAVVRRALVDILALARFSLGESRRARGAHVATVRIGAHGVSAATVRPPGVFVHVVRRSQPPSSMAHSPISMHESSDLPW